MNNRNETCGLLEPNPEPVEGQQTIAEFLELGGEIQQVAMGVVRNGPQLRLCKCGCEGKLAQHNYNNNRKATS